jgi:Zn-dependent peptidase ImmA (M78 family)/transcriptional regulator with XRE-family HTH domain
VEENQTMNICEKLRYARERARLTGAQVRERTDIGESSLSEFENGKREPSLSQLRTLAQAYNRSVAFFITEGPVPGEVVLWRERPSTRAEEIEVEFLRLCEQYHNLEVWTDDKISIRLPGPDTDKDRFGYSQAEELAKSFRREFPIGDYPAHALLNVLEEICGVKVFHLKFEPTGTAASTLSETFGPAILLNPQNCRWRRNHDLAHELFHLLTWRLFRESGGPKAEASDLTEREENFATCFARHLLMPAEPLRTAVNARMKEGKIRFEDLFDIAREFDVSIESLLWHMHFLYGRSNAQADETRKDIARAKTLASMFEDRSQLPVPIRPARFHALAVKALRRGEMSIGRCAEYLGISRQQAMKYVEQEATDNEEIQVAPA